MVEKLSVIHLLLVIAAAACIYLVVRELRRSYVSQWRLFAPGLAALFVALEMFLIQVAAGEPRWPFLAATGIGLVIGAVRGQRQQACERGSNGQRHAGAFESM